MEHTFQNKKSNKKKKFKKKGNPGVVALRKVQKLEKAQREETEVKFVQTAIINKIPVGGTGVELPFLYPAQALTDIGRVGNKISLLSASFRIQIQQPAIQSVTIADLSPTSVRVMLVLAKDGYLDSLTDMIERTLLSDSIYASREPAYTRRIKVFYDNIHIIDRNNVTTDYNANLYSSTSSRQYIEYFKTFKKPISIEFTGAGETTDTTGRLYFLFMSPDVSGQQARIDGTARIRYTDA